MTTTTGERATYRDVFATPYFTVVFTARTLSVAATTLRILALSVLVYAATKSPLLSALAFGIGFLPQVAGGLLFGALADRVRPRRLIVVGYLLEAAVSALLASTDLPVAASLTVVGLAACAAPVFGGASNRLIAELLTGDAYVLGRSVNHLASSGAQLVGLAFGGLAVAAVGARETMWLAAGCQVLAAVVTRLRLADLPAPPPSGHRSAVRQSLAGAAGLLGDRVVRRLMLVQWLPPAFVVGAEALLVAWAGTRGYGPGAAGALLAAYPVGMVVGDVVVGRLVPPDVRERLGAPLIVLLGLPLVAMLAPLPLWLAVALLAVSGCGFGYQLSVQRRFVEALPDGMRGQGFTLLSTGLMTLQGLGPALAGTAAEFWPPAVIIAVCGVATLSTAFTLVGSRR